jgi:DNA modification methylase
MQINTVHNGDALEILRTLPDNSIDSVVTDPPYGISFMQRNWDTFAGNQEYAQWVEQWARECLRVLKPGGHLLAFSGTRTYHALAWGVESAGFEIRDMIEWLYLSGFPKSMDIGKQFDKHGGSSNAWFGPWLRQERRKRGISSNELAKHFPSATGGITGCVRNWELGKNIPTPEQFNKLCDVLDLPFKRIEEVEREVIGTESKAASTYHTQNVGESVVRHDTYNITAPATPLAKQWSGWGTSLKPAHEPIVMARKPLSGTVCANVEQYGTGAINVDGCRIPTDDVLSFGSRRIGDGIKYGFCEPKGEGKQHEAGRFPANCITTDDDAWYSKYFNVTPQEISKKASKKDRNSTWDGKQIEGTNNHPTVKSVDLMSWLIRLVTPPSGIVLDPFAGSGSTLVAAKREGFSYIGIEREQEYVDIIHKRLA